MNTGHTSPCDAASAIAGKVIDKARMISSKPITNSEDRRSITNFSAALSPARVSTWIRQVENFEKFYVRIDILERLFVIIIENVKDNKIKLNPTMMNLLGCTKENFLKLIESMNYKMERSDKDGEIFFKYIPKKVKNKKFSVKEKIKDDSPFNILTNITFNYTK